MSSIDTFSHVHVANFFQMPVYWIVKEGELINLTDDDNDTGKLINQYYLSIGGGSGEHPALIFSNDAVLFRFLCNVKEIEEPQENACEPNMFDYKLSQLASEIQDKYFDKAGKFSNINEEMCYWKLNQNQWPLETFINIDKKFKQVSKSKENLERKMVEAVALFIINEMPLDHCIKDPQLIEFAKMVRSNKWTRAFKVKKMYEKFVGFTGVLNCQKYGTIMRDGKTVCNYDLNDWRKDDVI